MHKVLNFWVSVTFPVLSVLPLTLQAAVGPSPFHVSLDGEVEQHSNANRSPFSESELKELQVTTAINVNGLYDEYERLRASVDYRWSETDYREQSQANEPILTGGANLVMGGERDFYRIGLTHNSSELLVDPTEIDVNSNRTNRNILGASLTLRTKVNQPDQLALTLSRANVRYDTTIAFNDTDRFTSELNYIRRMTPLNTGGVKLSVTDVTYPNYVSSDYENALLYLYFQRQLRFLSYYAALGVNQTSSAANDTDSPYAELSVEYSTGVSAFSLSLSKRVTDNSTGQNSTTGLSSSDSVAGGSSPIESTADSDGSLIVSDQIERDTASIRFSSPALCARCSVHLQLAYEVDAYFSFEDQNSTDFSAGLGLSYQATRSAHVNIDLRHNAFDYTDRLEANNYAQNTARVAWGWSGKSGLDVDLFAETLERNYEQGGSYSGNLYGVRIRYQLM